MHTKLLTSLILSVSLISCGGGSDNASTNTPVAAPATVAPTTYAGLFLDTAVEGLTFTTDSRQSKTNIDGAFTFQTNEEIVFSIGDIQFPSIPAKSFITPLDIFDTKDINQIEVVNMLRLLQSLDIDGDPSNNIKISDAAHELAVGMTVDFSSDDFEQQVSNLVEMSGSVHKQLITTDMAIDHFQQTLSAIDSQAISNCTSTHAKVGHSGFFETFAHNVSGKATIIDDCTIEISQFNYDGRGPIVYFYGAKDHDYAGENAFLLGQELSGTVYSNDQLIIKLPEGKTLDDLTGLSVWCIDFNADFGHMTFTP
jgi:hypothetical protein